MGKIVTILVPAHVDYNEGDGFDVFFDGADGTIDYGNRMNGQRVGLWPGAPMHSGHGIDGYGVLPLGDSVWAGGWGEQAWGHGLWGYPSILRIFETWPLEYGTYKFAVKIYDAAGNVLGAAPSEQQLLVDALPQPPSNLSKVNYDEGTDELTLGFTGSKTFV